MSILNISNQIYIHNLQRVLDMYNNFSYIYNQVEIPGSGIVLDLPNFGGIFQNGIFAGIGFLLATFLLILIVAWVGFSIYGAFQIISSLGDPQKIEKGWKTIKSVWIGVSYFLLFFVIISAIAAFVGIGAPWRWAENLQQCAQGGPAAGRFYFQGKFEPDPNDPAGHVRVSFNEQLQRISSSSAPGFAVWCCEVDGQEYIEVRSHYGAVPAPMPSGCSVNSVIQKRTSPVVTTPGACRVVGEPCNVNSDCCSSQCASAGSVKYCL